jgi:hypothetical protein
VRKHAVGDSLKEVRVFDSTSRAEELAEQVIVRRASIGATPLNALINSENESVRRTVRTTWQRLRRAERRPGERSGCR